MSRRIGLPEIALFFFRPHGRIARVEFMLGAGFLVTLDLAVLAFLVSVGEPTPALILPMLILGLPMTIALFVIVAKRCHDLGLPGSFLLLLIVPVFGLAWLAALAMIPGNPGPNAYGPPPRFDG